MDFLLPGCKSESRRNSTCPFFALEAVARKIDPGRGGVVSGSAAGPMRGGWGKVPLLPVAASQVHEGCVDPLRAVLCGTAFGGLGRLGVRFPGASTEGSTDSELPIIAKSHRRSIRHLRQQLPVAAIGSMLSETQPYLVAAVGPIYV